MIDEMDFEVLTAVKETAEPVRIRFKPHAVDRFRQRVRPGLDPMNARLQLQGIAAASTLTNERPNWSDRTQATLWLRVADAAFIVVPDPNDRDCLVATTCVARGMWT